MLNLSPHCCSPLPPPPFSLNIHLFLFRGEGKMKPALTEISFKIQFLLIPSIMKYHEFDYYKDWLFLFFFCPGVFLAVFHFSNSLTVIFFHQFMLEIFFCFSLKVDTTVIIDCPLWSVFLLGVEGNLPFENDNENAWHHYWPNVLVKKVI